MASVTWQDRAYIQLATDPSQSITGRWLTAMGHTRSPRKESRVSIDGTRRVYRLAGVPVTHRIELRRVSRADFDALKGWEESPLVLRLPTGDVIWCDLTSIDVVEAPNPGSQIGVLVLEVAEYDGSAEV